MTQREKWGNAHTLQRESGNQVGETRGAMNSSLFTGTRETKFVSQRSGSQTKEPVRLRLLRLHESTCALPNLNSLTVKSRNSPLTSIGSAIYTTWN
jgi:hypothetical protein